MARKLRESWPQPTWGEDSRWYSDGIHRKYSWCQSLTLTSISFQLFLMAHNGTCSAVTCMHPIFTPWMILIIFFSHVPIYNETKLHPHGQTHKCSHLSALSVFETLGEHSKHTNISFSKRKKKAVVKHICTMVTLTTPWLPLASREHFCLM